MSETRTRTGIVTHTSVPHVAAGPADEIARFIAQNATLGLVMMDARQHCTYLNAAAEQIFGWTLEEILAQDKPLHDIIHYLRPDGRPYPMCECPIDRALPTRAREQGEDVFVHKDGHLYPVAFTASPIMADGVAVGTIIEVRDLTEEYRRSRALRESEARYGFLTESLPVQVWTAKPNGALDYANGRVMQYLGLGTAEILEDGWQRFVHPDDLPQALAKWTCCLATGDPYEVEFRLRRADGAYRWHLSRALAQRDAGGAIVRWFGTNTDVHDRREAEAALDRTLEAVQLERRRLREVFTHAPAVIGLYEGPQMRVTLANELWKRFTGRPDPLGRPFLELFPELEGSEVVDVLHQVRTTGEPFVTEEMHLAFDRNGDGKNEDMWWNFVLQPIFDKHGEVESVLVHAVEVTAQVMARHEVEQKAKELERLAAALERSNQDLNQFAYVASHDLKAPLRGIASLAHWLEDDLAEQLTESSRSHLELLKGRVERLDGLINGILQYSRAGRTLRAPEQVEVRSLLDETIELLAPPAEVRVSIVTDMPVVAAERAPFQQIFLNLIDNGIKFNHSPGAVVEVGCRDDGPMWLFWVRDNGPGIAPEYQDRIWGIFQKLEARDRVEGTGIGLSVVRKVIETRGGRIWMDSALGDGSTFLFTWPKRA